MVYVGYIELKRKDSTRVVPEQCRVKWKKQMEHLIAPSGPCLQQLKLRGIHRHVQRRCGVLTLDHLNPPWVYTGVYGGMEKKMKITASCRVQSRCHSECCSCFCCRVWNCCSQHNHDGKSNSLAVDRHPHRGFQAAWETSGDDSARLGTNLVVLRAM